ncbi:hypothetical protein LOTGIDRAFT_230533 [Lottia gigantea]|uniref:Uncharacterized protein n=1 Tax=Lottia gigantea TaxID=225164 RepID=V4AWV0_LOTGI|nr:hypothetical protein LOTGIDRAFT_230533 [Lottia gigantea]ESP01983.1 hypothetical protein LOTGIDRAFT_230533 [Lottia gigantea]
MPRAKMGNLLSCFSSKKEDSKGQKVQKKPRQYDEVDIVNEPEKRQEEKKSTKEEPALNYVEVDIKPSDGATTKIVGSEQTKTQYSTIDIEATEKRKLSTQNTEET